MQDLDQKPFITTIFILLASLCTTQAPTSWAQEKAIQCEGLNTHKVKTETSFEHTADYCPPKKIEAEGTIGAVMLHDFGSNRTHLRSLGRYLQNANVASITLDMKAHGEIPEDQKWANQTEEQQGKLAAIMLRDVISARAALESHKELRRHRYYLVSVGSAALLAVRTTIRDENVEKVVLVNPPEPKTILSFNYRGDLLTLSDSCGSEMVVVIGSKALIDAYKATGIKADYIVRDSGTNTLPVENDALIAIAKATVRPKPKPPKPKK